jgi:hypothetical protein
MGSARSGRAVLFDLDAARHAIAVSNLAPLTWVAALTPSGLGLVLALGPRLAVALPVVPLTTGSSPHQRGGQRGDPRGDPDSSVELAGEHWGVTADPLGAR